MAAAAPLLLRFPLLCDDAVGVGMLDPTVDDDVEATIPPTFLARSVLPDDEVLACGSSCGV